MNGLTHFVGNPAVHDTVLATMIITSFLAAIRRIKEPTKWWHLGWNFLFDWATGFWSMKTGQPLHSSSTLLETRTDGANREVSLKTETSSDPTPPVTPAKP